MKKSIDETRSTPRPWYLGFHLPNGGYDEKVHLFYQDKEESPFKDYGILKEAKKDYSNLHMSPCFGLKLMNGGLCLKLG